MRLKGPKSDNVHDRRAVGHREDRQNPNTAKQGNRLNVQRVNRYTKGDPQPKQSELDKLIKEITRK